jgi:hypothetical protein
MSPAFSAGEPGMIFMIFIPLGLSLITAPIHSKSQRRASSNSEVSFFVK